MTEIKKLPDETEEQFLWKIGQLVDSGQVENWTSINNIINKEILGDDETIYRTESAWRKRYQVAKKFYNNCFSKMKSKEYQEQVESMSRELERKKIQLRDERNAWQKQNYIDSRVEQKLDYLEVELLSQGKVNFDIDIHDKVNIKSDNDMLIILSDFHIGQTFCSMWGEYDSNIAKKRLNKLLNEVIAIRELYNSEKCYISLQGDMISGNIHKTIQVTNRENVIEQIKIASELISSFCYELTKVFNVVFLSSVVGNHTRLDKKEESLHDERLDDIIAWGIELSLKHIKNFHVLKRNLDSGIADIDIRGKTYIAVHGDYDGFNKASVSNLCMYLGFVPYAITYGHLHTCAFDEVNGVKMIRGGSLVGSGDSYTMEKRLCGKASQMVCICNNKGIVCHYPIELN